MARISSVPASPTLDYNSENLQNRLIGVANETEIEVCGQNVKALVDTGAMVSTISEEFYNAMSNKPVLKALTEFQLDVYAAGGASLPYTGYVEVEVRIPRSNSDPISVVAPVLVTETTKYKHKVPVIIGTNILRIVRDHTSVSNKEFSDPWELAIENLNERQSIPVRTTNMHVMTIGPNEVKTIHGIVKNSPHITTAVTEQMNTGQSGNLLVCPRVISLSENSKKAKIPVRICNLSATAIEIKPRSMICSLSEVKVVDSWSPDLPDARSDEKVQGHGLNVKVNVDGFSSDHTEQIDQLLSRWKHIFSTGITDIGRTNLVEHEIKLHDNIPFREPYRRIPPGMYEEVRQHLKEMLEIGAIRKSSSPYCSNVVLCRKSDGSLRFCIDLRKLNNRTIKDAYSLPRSTETMDSLIGSKFFSKLDLRSGYWQVELKEEDKHKTAFTVGPLGFYECNRMPFGLTNAPATFQRLMEACMGEMHLKECLIFLDDILIFSSTFEEHLERLESVFDKLEKHNLKLKPSKCEFFMREVKYLGHVVSEDGIRTDPDKTEALKTWPVPHNIKTLRSFLGFAGYYRRFVKNYAKIIKPLNDLLVGHPTNKKGKKSKRNKVPWEWGPAQQSAFNTIIDKLTSPPVLAYADFSKPFTVTTDASSDGLGAVLYQEQDGHERVIAYASRGLRASERNYPAHKLEFLCLKWALCDKFHDYLYGNTFVVRTDNNPLTYVTRTAKLDSTGHRWLAALSNYNFKLIYKSGQTIRDADGLSRRPQVSQAFPDVMKAITEGTVSAHECFAFAETVVVSEIAANLPDDPKVQNLQQVNWKTAQGNDADIAQVITLVQTGEKPKGENLDKYSDEVQKYVREWGHLEVKDGILYRNSTLDGENIQQIVLPKSLREMAFTGLHSDVGHPGRDKTLWLVKQRFYWPGLEKDVAKAVESCSRCVCAKTRPVPSATLVPIQTTRPLELVCIDFLSLEPSKGGYENILVITDHFTRYALAIPTRNQLAKTTAKALFDNFIVHYSFPERLHSDRGQNFESKVIQELCKIAGMKKSRTTPYHPMGNGMVEKFNSTLLRMLRTLHQEQKSDWKSYIPALVHAYNATKHDSTGFAPHFLMFGWHPRLAIDAYLGLDKISDSEKSRESYAQKMKKRLEFAYNVAQKESAKQGQRYKGYYDKKVRYSSLNVGDRVLVRNVSVRGKNKLGDKWERIPYIVIEQPNLDLPVFKVQKEGNKGPVRTLHRNLLLPFMSIDDSISRSRLESEQIETGKSRSTRKSRSVPQETGQGQSERSGSDSDSSEEPSFVPYVIPARRNSVSEQFRPYHTSSFDRGNASGNISLDDSNLSHSHGQINDTNISNRQIDNSQTLEMPAGSESSWSHDSALSPERSQRPQRNRKAPERYGDWIFAMNAVPDGNGIVYI